MAVKKRSPKHEGKAGYILNRKSGRYVKRSGVLGKELSKAEKLSPEKARKYRKKYKALKKQSETLAARLALCKNDMNNVKKQLDKCKRKS